ncbi:thiamine-phosphate pyrophosphorylase [Shewanella xiamenensis]|uniref:thiamine phosphate synthase n=1 Tax=Shewanella xiamenensis TaxID=332186 RepID=UPI001186CCC6|nr:thiamine phosphate synthase [Shewanella xiamenensis]TVL19152.1 thiamine-phosphate pyrophosphorylase [Shewanella xiamenensis]TVL23514.1 thiamine-phosphate pyrophosphorylase [Shewanella xiamenensis]TVL28804.1 thiamine-phosphate pyrophosphorylase [Shewanella xiamenensis]TVL31937.1 thiamine-phosphate pyrophosphorylase [Shewanella xiamenensis]TVP01283.1 thiamine-phosphate pyrophosphorylase [Shewanella xiamenensis]
MTLAKDISLVPPKPIVWTIAGSDSGGGAGIQADLATIKDLGGHGCSVITTLTAQSSVAVELVEPVSEAMLRTQLSTLLADLPPQAIKIGLLANQQQVHLVADWLAGFKTQFPLVPVILDPVMVASCGDELGDKSTASKPLDFAPFKGLISLITPNVQELARLTVATNKQASPIHTKAEFAAAAMQLSVQLACSVLAKGGDIDFAAQASAGINTRDSLSDQKSDITSHRSATDNQPLAEDLLICHQVTGCSPLDANGGFWLSSARINTRHNHGSGCTLSSAIASVLAFGFVLQDAVVVAKAYVNQGLTQAQGIGKGPGPLARTAWPHSLTAFPHVTAYSQNCLSESSDVQCGAFKRLEPDLGIYPVVDNLLLLEQLLAMGVKTVQLRIKSKALKSDELEAQIQTAITLGKHYEAQLFINDHWQLAIKHGAFGVHLGQEDLAVTDLNAIHTAGLALGISSHGYFELLRAHQHAPSYIALGHIFPTTTKQMPSAPQGLFKLTHYVELLKAHYPLVAIGGIGPSNLAQVKATGVSNIAVVRAITESRDPIMAFAELT